MSGGEAESFYYCAQPQGFAEVDSTYKGARMILADFRSEHLDADLATLYEASGLADLPSDVLILRGADEQFARQVNEDGALAQRITDKRVLCVTGSTDPNNPWPDFRPIDWAVPAIVHPPIAAVRSLELLGLLEARGAILEEEHVHYELPTSGWHVSRYVKLRKAISDPDDAGRVADWLLPQMTDGCQVVISHRGLGTLKGSLRSQALQRFGWEVAVYDLPPYSDKSKDPHLPENLPERSGEERFLIIGVDFDGTRGNHVRSRGFQDAAAVALVETHPNAASSPAWIHVPAARCHPRDCEPCQSGKSRVDLIDPDDEERRPRDDRQELTVTDEIIREREEFWQFVDEASAALVHTAHSYGDDPTGPERRDRSVDIDVPKLLEHDAFGPRCRAQLADLPPPDCILIPRHEATAALKDLAISAFEEIDESAIFDVPRSGELGDAGRAAFRAKRVLLLDEMLVTGATLKRLIGGLKACEDEERFADLDLYGFVVLNGAATDRISKNVKNRFKKRGERNSRLHEAARVYLPPPSDGCPWCKERRLLTKFRASLGEEHGEAVDRRLTVLDDTPFSGLSPVNDASDRVIGTVAGDMSATTAILAWASGLQQARAKAAPRRYLRLDQTLSWRDWSQYAGILRLATEDEVRYGPHEDEFIAAWQQETEQLSSDRLAEFAWAAAEGKLTPKSAAAVLETLSEMESDDPALAMHRRLIQMTLGSAEEVAYRASL